MLHAWVTDAMHRVLPDTRPERSLGVVPVARGERLSFQIGLRREVRRGEPDGERATTVRVACRRAAGVNVRIRRVGLVPVPHYNTPALPGHFEGRLPGLQPDPLFDETETRCWPNESQGFWLTVKIDPAARTGPRTLEFVIEHETSEPGRPRPGMGIPGRGRPGSQESAIVARLALRLEIRPVTVEPRRDFPVTNWFYTDALLDFYALDGFADPRFWPIAERYFRNVAEHGQDTLYVPVFTPPLDGVKRPTQLVGVTRAGGTYRFDWSDARQWVRRAARAGVRRFEFTHLFTQWGAAHAIRVYHGQGRDERLLWPADAPATGPVYRGFLSQFLPQLQRFCASEGILARSMFHTSDEPHGEPARTNYAAARAMLRDLAPWMTTMDALTEIDFARQGLVDMPIPSTRTTLDFIREGIPCWTYYCCGPRGRYLQRLMDTPLAKIRAHGWLFYRTGVRGFLHWGYNYWYRRQSRAMIDPFAVSDGGAAPGWAYGDTFMVYPGADGPIDSIRWEVFADSLNDYALLQSLGVDRDAALLRPFRAFDRFPFSANIFLGLRKKLLGRIR